MNLVLIVDGGTSMAFCRFCSGSALLAVPVADFFLQQTNITDTTNSDQIKSFISNIRPRVELRACMHNIFIKLKFRTKITGKTKYKKNK